ncbi:MAG: ATPase [Ruminococcus sp.]|nr:ATPase [Ruminococcus sp.]
MAEKYFLGSFSPEGFKGNFGEEIKKSDFRTVILKGGAGTGKSSLMKKVSAHFKDKDEVVEFYCSSDPDSLDGVLLKSRKRIIVDGTAPHVFEPTFPGVKEKILNLGDCWDERKLCVSSDKIIEITKEHKKHMERTKRYVKALSSIFSDTYSIGYEGILTQKLNGFVDRLIKKLAIKRSFNHGEISIRQLSALTPQGYKTLTDTLDGYEIYLLKDSYFAGSDIILKALCDIFTSRGKDVYASPLNIFDHTVYEHLLIPEMRLAFISSNPLTALRLDNVKAINVHRFYDKQHLSQRKSRLKLNKKACCDLTLEASRTMKTALKIHDELEKYYILAMDFDKVGTLCKNTIESFK